MWQASWVGQGWRIAHSEVSASGAELLVDGRGVALRGRIDRIDVNQDSGVTAVLDYKSGATVVAPEKAHRRFDGTWVDLQLPLYRHLLQGLNIRGPVQLGYIAVPQDVSEVKEMLADWDEAALLEADEVARDIVRRIRNHEFWPPAQPGYGVPPDFAAICLEDVFDARIQGGDEEEVAAALVDVPATSVISAPASATIDDEPFSLDGAAPPVRRSRRNLRGTSP